MGKWLEWMVESSRGVAVLTAISRRIIPQPGYVCMQLLSFPGGDSLMGIVVVQSFQQETKTRVKTYISEANRKLKAKKARGRERQRKAKEKAEDENEKWSKDWS